MKRIKYACLEQTIHFMLKEDLPHEDALRLVADEYERYLAQLEKTRAKYKIISQTVESDGSIILDVKKQYNGHDCGKYFD